MISLLTYAMIVSAAVAGVCILLQIPFILYLVTVTLCDPTLRKSIRTAGADREAVSKNYKLESAIRIQKVILVLGFKSLVIVMILGILITILGE